MFAKIKRRRFADDAGGATAIEFGLVAAPFMALVLVIMEVGYTYFVAASLDDAMRIASNDIQRGYAQEKRLSEGAFKQRICDLLPVPSRCFSNLAVDVRRIETKNIGGFSKDGDVLGVSSSFVQGAWDPKYCPGNGGDYVAVRVAYRLPDMLKFMILRAVEGTTKSKKNYKFYTVEASRIFRNEPFTAEDTQCDL